jgi:hypothetical protein
LPQKVISEPALRSPDGGNLFFQRLYGLWRAFETVDVPFLASYIDLLQALATGVSALLHRPMVLHSNHAILYHTHPLDLHREIDSPQCQFSPLPRLHQWPEMVGELIKRRDDQLLGRVALCSRIFCEENANLQN